MEADNNGGKYTYLARFPPEFTEFLIYNKVPLQYYSDVVFDPICPVRYIRFKPSFPADDYIQKTMGLTPIGENIDHLKTYKNYAYIPQFYAIPENIKISSLDAYDKGNLYGIDLSSASVVLALNPQNNENILDLCCCPGAKLLFIGDLMMGKKEKIMGSLTGVDINTKRLKICESLCKKYSLEWIELKGVDGVTYKSEILYDKVLLDAECTHDGSIKHLKKYLPEYNIYMKNKEIEEKMEFNEENLVVISNKEKKRRKKQEEINKNTNIYITDKTKKNEWTMDDFKERVLDKKKLKEITDLQMNLLKNAFSLVKIGGIIIYSTCSFIKAQNEDIILRFCEENKGKVELLDVFPEEIRKCLKCSPGFLEKTIRFDPINSNSGGMFIASLKKII